MTDDDDEPHPDDPISPAEQATVDATDVKEFKKRGRKRKIAERHNDEFWRMALTTEQGRRALFELLCSAHTFETPFQCGPNGFPQPEATWFRSGESAFGLRLYHSWLRIAPGLANLMLQENDARFSKPLVRKGE